MTRRGRLVLLLFGVTVVAVAAIIHRAPQPHSPPSTDTRDMSRQPPETAEPAPGEVPRDPYLERRMRMVDVQLRGRDIIDDRVLRSMETVPRHEFVSAAYRDVAYGDRPQPIGHGQTISQPYIVALMTQLAGPGEDARVLDVGTGSGYQAAVLSLLVKEVYSIEIIGDLAEGARERLRELGYRNVDVRCGDGYRGWEEHAPFDAIIVAAAPDHVPQPLIDQLAVGGRLVIPVGRGNQELLVIEKQPEGGVTRRTVTPVAFVPMTGEAER